MIEITHKTIIASLTSETRKALMERSDMEGIKQTVCHFGLIILCSVYLYFRLPLWQFFVPIQGLLLVFLFTALHETIHGTPFKTTWLNTAIAHLCGFIIFLPAQWFKLFHFAHHRHTNSADLDPELATPKPQTVFEYFKYLSGIPVEISLLKTLINNAMGENQDDFIANNHHRKITNESRIYLLIYALLALISWLSSSLLLLWLWLIPIVIGQPFLRTYLLAEHVFCPQVNNMLLNSRTTITTGFVRFLAWNMPYHAEHHSLPSVPFHKLPEFHQYLKEHLGTIDNGYSAFHKKMITEVSTKTL